jgi:hypothetical protein
MVSLEPAALALASSSVDLLDPLLLTAHAHVPVPSASPTGTAVAGTLGSVASSVLSPDGLRLRKKRKQPQQVAERQQKFSQLYKEIETEFGELKKAVQRDHEAKAKKDEGSKGAAVDVDEASEKRDGRGNRKGGAERYEDVDDEEDGKAWARKRRHDYGSDNDDDDDYGGDDEHIRQMDDDGYDHMNSRESRHSRGGDFEDEEGNQGSLSDVDDSFVDSMLLSKQEVQRKTAIWTQMNLQYIKEQAEKMPSPGHEGGVDGFGSRQASMYQFGGGAHAAGAAVATGAGSGNHGKSKGKGKQSGAHGRLVPNTAAEAIKQNLMQRKLSGKINYDALQCATATLSSNPQRKISRARQTMLEKGNLTMMGKGNLGKGGAGTPDRGSRGGSSAAGFGRIRGGETSGLRGRVHGRIGMFAGAGGSASEGMAASGVSVTGSRVGTGMGRDGLGASPRRAMLPNSYAAKMKRRASSGANMRVAATPRPIGTKRKAATGTAGLPAPSSSRRRLAEESATAATTQQAHKEQDETKLPRSDSDSEEGGGGAGGGPRGGKSSSGGAGTGVQRRKNEENDEKEDGYGDADVDKSGGYEDGEDYDDPLDFYSDEDLDSYAAEV